MMDKDFRGIVLVKKPAGKTSFHMVAMIRRIVGKRVRVGHAGTLDPFATGLLVIGVGREATKTLGNYMRMPKVYVATGKIGLYTDTLDVTGNILSDNYDTLVTREQLKESIASFGNSYEQIPPVYSALKHQGKRLYALARKGKMLAQDLFKIAEEKKREVKLYELSLLSFDFPYFTIRAQVSHGTYLRVLIDDIAQRCGVRATTIELERTQIGDLVLQDAVEFGDDGSVATIAG